MIALLLAALLQVPENRAVPGGRMIDLNVVVLEATGKGPKREPLFILQGGPGQAATSLADFYARTFAPIREQRDIVLVDQRGTGKSNGLFCEGGFFDVAAVEACRDDVMKRADPRFYTTAEAVRDLDEVRRKLGYERINLYGTSYGTRVALEYARAWPGRVRSMLLKGVLAPSQRHLIDSAVDTQHSLERAASRYPGLLEDVDAVLAAGVIPRDDIAVELRGSLHSMSSIEKLPAMMHAAAGGDWAPLAEQIAAHRKALNRDLAAGMYLSVVCAEDFPRVTPEEAQRVTAGTIAGDYWYRRIAAACAVWPHTTAPAPKPLRSDIPTLLVSGAFDPVTPPKYAEEVSRTLTRSRHVVVPNGSHSFAGMGGCVDVMMSRFVLDPDPRAVDASCVK
jgi:pimeloyl-ACP methyl ester carboxylesterase